MHVLPMEKHYEIDKTVPKTLPRIAHEDPMLDLINAVRAGKKETAASFDYGARLTEFSLLGNLAQHAGVGKKIDWDGAGMKVTNLAGQDIFNVNSTTTYNLAQRTYSQTNGNGAIAWSLSNGPAGLSIASGTGIVSGTPSVTGTFSRCASGNTGRVPSIHATYVHGSNDGVRGRSSLRDTPLRALQRCRALERRCARERRIPS
jgi:hypothetical protein